MRGALLVTTTLVLSCLVLVRPSSGLPPAQGDWVVAGPELVENQTVVVNGNVTVTSTGALTLRNVTLLINSNFDGEQALRVNPSGSLDVVGGRVAAIEPTHRFRFDILGNATLRGTVVEHLWGGIHVLGGSLEMSDTIVRHSQADGVNVLNGRLEARNVTVYDTSLFGVYLDRTPNATIDASLLYDYRGLGLGGIWAIDSPNFTLTNTTLRGYFLTALWAQRTDGLLVERCVFRDREPGPSILIEGSENVVVRDTLLWNTTLGAGIEFTTDRSGRGSSGRLENVTIADDSPLRSPAPVEVARSHLNVSRSHLGGGLGIYEARVEVTNSSIAGTVDLTRATYVATNTTHDRGTGILLFVVNGSRASLTNYPADFSSLYVDLPDSEYNASNPSEIVVRNYLGARTVRSTGAALSGTDLKVSSGGVPVYETAGFGGTDPPTGPDGRSPTMTLVDRVYHRDWAIPGVKPFENITYVPTLAEVAYPGSRFANNPRAVNMARSHEETFVGDAIPPSVVSVSADPDPVDLGQPIELRAVAVDDWRVASVLAEVVGPTGTRWNVSLSESLPQLFTVVRTFPDLGDYLATITAADPAGWTASAVVRFRVADLSPPTIGNLTVSPQVAGPGDQVRVAADVADRVGVASVSLDVSGPGVAENLTMTRVGPTYEAVLRYTALGVYDVVVWASDTSGLWASAGARFSVGDFLPPATTLQVGTPRVDRGPLTYVRPDTSLSLSADDGPYGSGVDWILYRWDGGTWMRYLSPLAPQGQDGPHLLEYYSFDRAGNEEPVHPRVLVLDATAPAMSWLFGTPRVDGTPLFVSPATPIGLNVTDSVGIASLTLSIDGVSVPYLGPVSLPEGNHVLTVRAVDLLGTASDLPALSVVSDGTPPRTTWSASPAVGSQPVVVGPESRFVLSTVDSGVGVQTSRYAIDGRWTTYRGPFDLASERGYVSVSFGSKDHLGNAEDVQVVLVFVDADPPTAVATAEPSSPLVGEVVHLDGSASFDDGWIASSTWRVRGPSGELDLVGAQTAFVVNSTGRYTIVLSVTDLLGRESSAILTIEVAASPPPPPPGPDWGLVAALAGVAFAILGIAAWVLARQRRRHGKDSDSRPPGQF